VLLLADLVMDTTFTGELFMLWLLAPSLQLAAAPQTPALLVQHEFLLPDAWAPAKPGSGLWVRPPCEWQTPVTARAKLCFSLGISLEKRQKMPGFGSRRILQLRDVGGEAAFCTEPTESGKRLCIIKLSSGSKPFSLKCEPDPVRPVSRCLEAAGLAVWVGSHQWRCFKTDGKTRSASGLCG